MNRMVGYVFAMLDLHLLSPTEASQWFSRIKTCPGHDDDPRMSWCSYCGNRELEDEEGIG